MAVSPVVRPLFLPPEPDSKETHGLTHHLVSSSGNRRAGAATVSNRSHVSSDLAASPSGDAWLSLHDQSAPDCRRRALDVYRCVAPGRQLWILGLLPRSPSGQSCSVMSSKFFVRTVCNATQLRSFVPCPRSPWLNFCLDATPERRNNFHAPNDSWMTQRIPQGTSTTKKKTRSDQTHPLILPAS